MEGGRGTFPKYLLALGLGATIEKERVAPRGGLSIVCALLSPSLCRKAFPQFLSEAYTIDNLAARPYRAYRVYSKSAQLLGPKIVTMNPGHKKTIYKRLLNQILQYVFYIR